MIHTFSVEAAKELGLLPAILLNHIAYWVAHNEANGINYHDGAYWTYNSKKAFSELFPYATPNQIRYALDKLRDSGAIMVGNYNKQTRDRTLWYTLTDYGRSIVQISQMHWGNFTNALGNIPQPLPNNNADIKPYSNNKEVDAILKELPADLVDTVKAFLEHRKKLKSPMTAKALELAVKKANKLAGGDTQIVKAIFEQSMMNGWKGVFPLKEEKVSQHDALAQAWRELEDGIDGTGSL